MFRPEPATTTAGPSPMPCARPLAGCTGGLARVSRVCGGVGGGRERRPGVRLRPGNRKAGDEAGAPPVRPSHPHLAVGSLSQRPLCSSDRSRSTSRSCALARIPNSRCRERISLQQRAHHHVERHAREDHRRRRPSPPGALPIRSREPPSKGAVVLSRPTACRRRRVRCGASGFLAGSRRAVRARVLPRRERTRRRPWPGRRRVTDQPRLARVRVAERVR